jgi:hypothetical protein
MRKVNMEVSVIKRRKKFKKKKKKKKWFNVKRFGKKTARTRINEI